MGDLQRYRFPAFITGLLVLVLAIFIGRPAGWRPAIGLLPLVLAAWVMDPLVLAIAVIVICLALSFGSQWLPGNTMWMPGPLMIWLTIAIIHLVRLELQL